MSAIVKGAMLLTMRPAVVHLPCRHIHYVSKLPDSRQAFDKQLAQFYAEHGAILLPPTILHIPLDCYTVFCAVAERGGYEGVTGTRYLRPTRYTYHTNLAGLLCTG